MDQNYRLGPGDLLVLILTGDVELAYPLDVTREGFVVIPQVGQVYVANLTLGQVEEQLYGRLAGSIRACGEGPTPPPGSSSRSPGSATSRSSSRATWCVPGPTRCRARAPS